MEWKISIQLRLKTSDNALEMTKDQYAALRYKDLILLLLRFAMVFAWSMQFIIIEWQVYSITKDPLSLEALSATVEVIPAFSMALLPDTVDQRKKDFAGNAVWLSVIFGGSGA
jgi:hypothetical protein